MGVMNRTEAISLFRSSRLALAEARVREPDVTKIIGRSATTERTATIERLRASLPMAAADALRDIDVRAFAGGTLGSALRSRIAGALSAGLRNLSSVRTPRLLRPERCS